MNIVSGSILSRQDDKIYEILNNSSLDYLHLDVMDKTMTAQSAYLDVNLLKKNELPLDIHIMSLNPLSIIERYISLTPTYLTIQVECHEDIEPFLSMMTKNNIKAGLALKTGSDISLLEPYLDKIDLVLIMSVELGNSGSKFNQESLSKIKTLTKLREEKGYNYLISIDGGINDKTISLVKDYVDMVVSGSYLVSDDLVEERIAVLRHG